MRDSMNQGPSLFDAESSAEPAILSDDKIKDRIARDFIGWCCSFGNDFRNSPDIANLRFWAQRAKVKLKEEDEAKVLATAALLFLKRLEQLTRSEPTN